MSTSNIRITDDILDETTGVYTCMLYFTDDIDQAQKEKFLKKHIMRLNYEDINFVFNPSLGSKVSASPHAENKNLVVFKDFDQRHTILLIEQSTAKKLSREKQVGYLWYV